MVTLLKRRRRTCATAASRAYRGGVSALLSGSFCGRDAWVAMETESPAPRSLRCAPGQEAERRAGDSTCTLIGPPRSRCPEGAGFAGLAGAWRGGGGVRGRGRTAAGAGEVHCGAAGKRREGLEAREGQGVAGQVRAPTAIQALAAQLEHSQRKHLLCANPAPGSVRETGEPVLPCPGGSRWTRGHVLVRNYGPFY